MSCMEGSVPAATGLGPTPTRNPIATTVRRRPPSDPAGFMLSGRCLGRNVSKRPFKLFGWLAAADHVSIVDDGMGNTAYALREPASLLQANLLRVLAAGENFSGDVRVEAGDARGAHEDFTVGQALLRGEVGIEERVLQRQLTAFKPRPVQQPVCIECVPDPRVVAAVHDEAEGRGTLFHAGAILA